MIRLEKQGRRIRVITNSPLSGFRTAIPGAYKTTSGYWTVPLSIESCKLLKEHFPRGLVPSSELQRWVRGVVNARRQMRELAQSSDAQLHVLPRVAPRLYKAMRRRKYQCVGARFVADNHATLIADEPGLGKTLIAMAGILEAQIPGPYLVIAPKTASDSVWRREILRWLPREHRPILMPELRLQRERKLRLTSYGPSTWLIVHPEMAMMQEFIVCAECGKQHAGVGRTAAMLPCKHPKTPKCVRKRVPSYPKLFDIPWGAIVADEAHESLIVRTRSRLTQRRRGMEHLPLRGDGVKVALSGTPFEDKPHQLWGVLNWLDSATHSAQGRWTEMFWRKTGYSGFEVGEFIKEREGMLWDSLSTMVLRRTKLEVAKDLPPKTYVGSRLDPEDETSPVGVWLPMEGEQERAYREMEKDAVAKLESGRLTATSSLAELTRLKQMACSYGDIKQVIKRIPCERSAEPCVYLSGVGGACQYGGYHREPRFTYSPKLPSNKLNWVLANLEEWGFPNYPISKVVIVSFYTGILECFANAIETHFKTKPRSPLTTAISGRVPHRDRRGIIDAFNTDDGPAIMMLNVKAGGTAITIDTADRMIFVSQTRVPSQQTQAEDRIHRVSNPRACMYYYLGSEETVDVGTALANGEAAETSYRLLDGRRGLEYTRRVLDLSHTR